MAQTEGIEFVITGEASQAIRTLRNFASQATQANRAASNSSGFRRLANSLAQVSKTNLNSFNKQLNKLMSSLGRVAFYRAIRFALKAMSQAFDEGLKNAYAFSAGLSSVVDGRIAVALDGLTGHATTMKNQLGAAFGSLLTMIAPIINTLIGLITALATAITQLFAAFTGGTFLRAKNVTGKFADDMKKGGGAAKEWKNQLMGFDEINRLEDQSGGGGGGGASGLDPSDMFEVAEVGGIFATIAQKWRDLVDSLDFGPLLDSWERLKSSIKEFLDVIVSGLAWAWDNIFVPLAHWTIEAGLPAVIDALAAAFDFLGSALKFLAPYAKWTWENFLQPLASWTGDTFVALMEKITDLFQKLSQLLNGEISFGEFIDQIDGVQFALLTLGSAFTAVKLGAAIFNGAMALITSPLWEIIIPLAAVVAGLSFFKQGLDDWRKSGELTGEAFAKMSIGIGLVAIALAPLTGGWSLLVGAIGIGAIAIIGNWDKIKEAAQNLKEKVSQIWTSLKDSITDSWNGIKESISTGKQDLLTDWESIKASAESIANGVSTAWSSLTSSLSEAWSSIKEAFAQGKQDLEKDWENIKAVFSWDNIRDTFRSIGSNIIGGLKDGILESVHGISAWVKTNIVDPLVNGVKNLLGIHSPSTVFSDIGSNIIDGLLEGLKNAWSAVETWFTGAWDTIKGFFGKKDNVEVGVTGVESGGVVEFSAQVKNDSAKWWSDVQTWWSAVVGDVQEFTTKLRDDSDTWWGNTVTWWEAKKTDTLEFAVNVKNDAAKWWSDVQSWWKGVVGELWTTLNIRIPRITVEWKQLGSLLGQTIEYPSFSILWNAKGGIVDGATLIGAGEAGKEAIIPLERNTQWISKVASELNSQMINGRNGTDMVSAMEDANDGVINAIFAVGAQVVQAMAENNRGGEIDWREVAKKVTKAQNQMARAGSY